MVYAQSTVKGHVRVKQNVLQPQVKFCFTVYDTLHLLKIRSVREKMQLKNGNFPWEIWDSKVYKIHKIIVIIIMRLLVRNRKLKY